MRWNTVRKDVLYANQLLTEDFFLITKSFLFMYALLVKRTDHPLAKNGVQVTTIKDISLVLWKQKFQRFK